MKYDEESFLHEVLAIPSVNGMDSERNMAVFLRDFLQECGVQAVVQEIDGKHANIIAVLEGETDEVVIWNGHLDTVPYGKISEWNSDPSSPVKRNGCYYARGASDMKGGLAAMVWTLGYMKQKGYMPKQTIWFCGTCDEERNGIGARHLVESGALPNASLLLIGEPTGGKLGIAQKGCVWMQLNLHGKTSHGAYPQEGINAIEYGCQIYKELKNKVEEKNHPVLGRSTIQISMLKGGIVPNMTPDEAEMTLDIRVVPGITTQMLNEWVNEIISMKKEETKGQLQVDIIIRNDRMAIEIAKEHPWVRTLDWKIECSNLPNGHIGINYFTDASILLKNYSELPVILWGPGEAEMAHKPNEYIVLKKYKEYIDVLMKVF